MTAPTIVLIESSMEEKLMYLWQQTITRFGELCWRMQTLWMKQV